MVRLNRSFSVEIDVGKESAQVKNRIKHVTSYTHHTREIGESRANRIIERVKKRCGIKIPKSRAQKSIQAFSPKSQVKITSLVNSTLAKAVKAVKPVASPSPNTLE